MTTSLLVDLLQQPKRIMTLSTPEWNLLLGQLRTSQLTLYFYAAMEKNALTEHIPSKIYRYINAEQRKVAFQRRQVNYELEKINNALQQLDIKATYLKGAAYLIADLPIANCRIFSDIDILVDQTSLDKAERALKLIGFASQKTDDYDQQYYRQYMHEIPPMQHVTRGTVVDVHHNILPVCTYKPIDISLFSTKKVAFKKANKQEQTLAVFSSSAMYLHCAIHLFHEGDFDKGLRDLADLAIMFTEFSNNSDDFEPQLISLAQQSNQQKSLFFALRYINKIFSTPLNDDCQQFVDEFAANYRYSRLSDFIFLNILSPYHPSCENSKVKFARLLAYIRGHLLRMPLRLLLPHLIRKFFAQITASNDKSTTNNQNKVRPDI